MHSRKKLYTFEIVFVVILIAIILVVCGCSKDDPESKTAKTERMLKASWKLNKLTVDGTDQTTLYSDLSITVTAGTYTAQNGEPIWPAAGTWRLTDATTINRDNDFSIKIESITETTLTLSLEWQDTTIGQGRVASIAGEHLFEFVKN